VQVKSNKGIEKRNGITLVLALRVLAKSAVGFFATTLKVIKSVKDE
jgi:hypothetical protein